MFSKPIKKPLNSPVIFYAVKNIIKTPTTSVPEEEKKKYKYFQKSGK